MCPRKILAALAIATSVAACSGGHTEPPKASCPSHDCTPPEGGQAEAAQQAAEGSSAAPTTPASEAGGPGKWFTEEQPDAAKDRFCGVVHGPVGWPTWPDGINAFNGASSNPSGSWDIAQSSVGSPPLTDADCPAELSFFQDFFANSANIQQGVTAAGNYDYHFRGSICSVGEDQLGVPDVQCTIEDRSQLHDTLIDRFTAYPR
jgi:hypothetical protein